MTRELWLPLASNTPERRKSTSQLTFNFLASRSGPTCTAERRKRVNHTNVPEPTECERLIFSVSPVVTASGPQGVYQNCTSVPAGLPMGVERGEEKNKTFFQLLVSCRRLSSCPALCMAALCDVYPGMHKYMCHAPGLFHLLEAE